MRALVHPRHSLGHLRTKNNKRHWPIALRRGKGFQYRYLFQPKAIEIGELVSKIAQLSEQKTLSKDRGFFVFTNKRLISKTNHLFYTYI